MLIDQDDEFEPQYYTREDAIRMAREEALRSLNEQPQSISFVRYVAEMHDYCLCEFIQEEGGWVQTMRCLAPDERMPGEEIRDESIRELAQAGNMVSAIRLYRSKHQVGLREAHEAVKLLLQ